MHTAPILSNQVTKTITNIDGAIRLPDYIWIFVWESESSQGSEN